MFTQGHRTKVKLELVQSFCCKFHEATQRFMMVDYVRKTTGKKSNQYGEYGLFEHLLFFFLGGGGGG